MSSRLRVDSPTRDLDLQLWISLSCPKLETAYRHRRAHRQRRRQRPAPSAPRTRTGLLRGRAPLSHRARETATRAASTLQDIGGEVDRNRPQGRPPARSMERSSQESESSNSGSDMSSAPSRLPPALTAVAAQYPLQTIAAIAGVSFAVGVALRLSRRSRRG